MTNQAQVEAYNKREIARIQRAFKAMDEQAQQEAKKIGRDLAEFARHKIWAASTGVGLPAMRIAQGSKVSQSAKTGELSIGFARQKFSGGATTQINYKENGGSGILAGWEFGSKKYPQFPDWSGVAPSGVGSKGLFIYPTLRAIQPSIVEAWEKSFSTIIDKWADHGGV